MPKYLGEIYFTHGSFSEVGEKQKAHASPPGPKKEGENKGQIRFRPHTSRLDQKEIKRKDFFFKISKLRSLCCTALAQTKVSTLI